MRLYFSAPDTSRLLSLFLGEPSSVGERPDAGQREALLELGRQWSGLVATELQAAFGEVELEVSQDDPSTALSAVGTVLRVADGEATVAARVQLDSNLMQAFDRRGQGRSEVPPEKALTKVDGLLRDGNLELLLDVELGVMLRFGRRHAVLREVLELGAGVVLELDREIQEPVDLLLNNRVIARGEVVVIDGNYGLRVTEVASPEQRLRSL